MNMPNVLSLPKTGSNVIVRCLQAEDLSKMYRIESDPDVKRYLNGPTRVPCEEWVRVVESKLSRYQTLAVLSKDIAQFAGRAALDFYCDKDYLDHEVTREIQVVISKDYWGRHFGREVCKILIAAAFDELGAEQVIGIVHPQNENSLKLLHLYGFEQTGVISKPSSRRRGHLRFVLPRSIYQEWPQSLCLVASMPSLPVDLTARQS
jgi:[ribosomal protein S5]-alanine N-acetyltransferase